MKAGSGIEAGRTSSRGRRHATFHFCAHHCQARVDDTDTDTDTDTDAEAMLQGLVCVLGPMPVERRDSYTAIMVCMGGGAGGLWIKTVGVGCLVSIKIDCGSLRAIAQARYYSGRHDYHTFNTIRDVFVGYLPR